MKMRQKIYNIVTVVLVLAGVAVLMYPLAGNVWNQFQQNRVAEGYAEAVSDYSVEERDLIRQEAVEYNRELLKDEVIVDPFDPANAKKVQKGYYEILDFQDDGVMGMLEIPCIKVKLPVYHGTSEEVLQKAVGHLEQTSFPVGGKGTHAVLSGHRGLPDAELFSNLNLMEDGDVFFLEVLGEKLAYRVDQIRTVEPDQLEDLAITAGEDYVTLMTCTPYAINSHRLLVRGTRIPYIEAMRMTEGKKEKGSVLHLYLGVALTGILLAILFVVWRMRRQKARKKQNRKKRKQQIWMSGILLAGILQIFSYFSVKAAGEPVYDAERTGSITIQLDEIGTEKKQVTLSCYQVGKLQKDAEGSKRVEVLSHYAELDLNLDALDKAEEHRKTVEKLTGYIRKHPETRPVKTERTDENGSCTFSDLEQGIYLLVQEGGFDTYGKIQDFLVRIPYQEAEGWEYEIQTVTKAEKPGESGNPAKTGDEFRNGSILLMLAALLAGTGALNRRKKAGNKISKNY